MSFSPFASTCLMLLAYASTMFTSLPGTVTTRRMSAPAVRWALRSSAFA